MSKAPYLRGSRAGAPPPRTAIATPVDPSAAAVVIPVLNDASRVVRAIRGSLGEGPGFLVVVDDGSTDGSGEAARAVLDASQTGGRTAHAAVLRQENHGPASARNLGARWALDAGASVLVFLDADCEPDPGWLQAMLRQIGAGDVHAVGAQIRMRPPGTAIGRAVFRLGGVRHRLHGAEIDYLVAASLAVRSDAFSAIGGFDERAGTATNEDTDLSWRLRCAGFSLAVEQSAVVTHDDRSTLRGVWTAAIRSGRGRYRLDTLDARHRLIRDLLHQIGVVVAFPVTARRSGALGLVVVAARSTGYLTGVAAGLMFDRSVRRSQPKLLVRTSTDPAEPHSLGER